MKKYAITFPGQGSQSVGMTNAYADNQLIKKTFHQASEIIGEDLWRLISEENELIHQTIYTQPIMLTAGFVTWKILVEAGFDQPCFVAGHSLGEITALVAAEVISFDVALLIVKKRAELMQAAVPEGIGGMAAILGLADEDVMRICKEAEGDGVIEPVNFNSPGQVVVAGHQSAIDKQLDVFKQAGAKRAVKLPVSVPSHCSLMQTASDQFKTYLEDINFNTPNISIIHNVDFQSHSDPEAIKKSLSRQLSQPVQWTKTIEFMVNQGVEAFFEAGPNKVLLGLNRRIFKDGLHISVNSLESINEIKENL